MTYSLLIGDWIIYFLLHSVLADAKVKTYAEKALGNGYRFYRLVYSFISTAGLIGLMFMSGSIPGEYFFERDGMARYFSMLLTTFGVILVQASLRHHGLKAFLGFAHEQSGLHTAGLLSWIRHPIHAGVILVTLGFFLFIPNLPTLVSCSCVFAYLPIGIFLEERKMVAAYGDAYRKYRDEVPALFPRWSRLTGT
jgi:protein-S-isoprenylcysteine O-methyltransferase Ste14